MTGVTRGVTGVEAGTVTGLPPVADAAGVGEGDEALLAELSALTPADAAQILADAPKDQFTSVEFDPPPSAPTAPASAVGLFMDPPTPQVERFAYFLRLISGNQKEVTEDLLRQVVADSEGGRSFVIRYFDGLRSHEMENNRQIAELARFSQEGPIWRGLTGLLGFMAAKAEANTGNRSLSALLEMQDIQPLHDGMKEILQPYYDRVADNFKDEGDKFWRLIPANIDVGSPFVWVAFGPKGETVVGRTDVELDARLQEIYRTTNPQKGFLGERRGLMAVLSYLLKERRYNEMKELLEPMQPTNFFTEVLPGVVVDAQLSDEQMEDVIKALAAYFAR